MSYRQVKPKNWRAFIEYLSDHLADAIDQHVYDEIRYLADLYQEKENCPHRRTQEYTTGSMTFTAGQVVDDIRTITVCLDCGAQLETETE
jgi:hypothetical protein